MTIEKVVDEDTSWGGQIRSVIGYVNGTRTICADEPSTDSGLTACAADGTTNDRAALQAMLDYVSTEWGAGTVLLPAGKTIKCDTGITIPANVQLAALQGSTLNFSGMTGTATAVTVDDDDRTPLVGVRMVGPGEGSTITALSVSGTGCAFRDLEIRDFGVGIDLAHENTYIHRFLGGAIGDCGICVYGDYSARGTTNAGERCVFVDITFFNSPVIFRITNNQGGWWVDRCSLDYSALFGYIDNSHVAFTNCHFESNFVASPNGYLFNLASNARVDFIACNGILGSTGGEGLRFLINPQSGPSNFGSGRVQWAACKCYFVDTSSTGRQRFSDELAFIEELATTAVFETPFVSKWSPVTATPGANAGDAQTSATTTVAIDRDGSGHVTGEITVTASAAPGSGNYLPVRVEF